MVDRSERLRTSLVDTLMDLSDFEAQRRYKNAVPFVHIPIELAEQMSQYKPSYRRSDWYEELIPDAHVEERLGELFEALKHHFDTCPRDRSDIPGVVERESWRRVQRAAQRVIAQLYQTSQYGETLSRHWDRSVWR